MNPKQFGEKTQYKNTTTRQLRDGMQVICLNQGLKIEDAFQFAHDLSPEVIYEENDGAGTLSQWVLKESVVLDTNIATNVVLTTGNKATYLRPFGGGQGSVVNQIKLPTYIVSSDVLADFNNVQAALDNAAINNPQGARIFVKNGNYSITTSLLLKSNNITIECESENVRFNMSVGTSFAKNGNLTPVSQPILDFYFKKGVIERFGGVAGIAFDWSNIERGGVDSPFIKGFDKGFYFSGTANYNNFNSAKFYGNNYNVYMADSVNLPCNFNIFTNCQGDVNSNLSGNTGYYLCNAEHNTFINCAVEPGVALNSQTDSTGIYFGNKTKGNVFVVPYLENNKIGVKVTATPSDICEGNKILNGNISGNQIEIQDTLGRLSVIDVTVGYTNVINTKQFTNFNSKNGYEVTIDTSNGGNKGFVVKNKTNFAHSGGFFEGETMNGSDTVPIYTAVNRGTGNAYQQLDGSGTVNFAVSNTGKVKLNATTGGSVAALGINAQGEIVRI